jgi:hypothetical protein
MTRHGAYANRGAGHRSRRARLYAAAPDEAARLSAAFDWFRSSARLLARRRPPEDADQQAHKTAAAGLIRGMTEHLRQAAEAIDRGDYDTGKG